MNSDEGTQRAPATARTGMSNPESRKPSLLIVDDDPLIIDTLAFFLSREFAVRTLSLIHI